MVPSANWLTERLQTRLKTQTLGVPMLQAAADREHRDEKTDRQLPIRAADLFSYRRVGEHLRQ